MSFPIGIPLEKIPQDPGERQVIVVVSASDMERLKYSRNPKEHLENIPPGALFVYDDKYMYEKESQIFWGKLRNQGLIQENNILFQNTYEPDIYSKADQIKNDVLDKKYRYYSTICNYLGARQITIKIVKEETASSKKKMVLKVWNPLFFIDSDVNSFSNELRKAYMCMKVKLDGSLPNIDFAQKYIEDNSLDKDKDIKYLVDNLMSALKQEGIDHPNRMRKFEQRINLFSQVETSLDTAVNIKVPEYLTKIELNLNKYAKKVEKFESDIEIDFGLDETK